MIVMSRLAKLEGVLIAMAEQVTVSNHLPAELVDNFYDRWYRAEDAITRLKGTEIWHSVDVDDLDVDD